MTDFIIYTHPAYTHPLS